MPGEEQLPKKRFRRSPIPRATGPANPAKTSQLYPYKRLKARGHVGPNSQYEQFDDPQTASILLTEKRCQSDKPYPFESTPHREHGQFSVGRLRGPNGSGMPLKMTDDSVVGPKLKDGGPVWIYFHEHMMKEVTQALRAVTEMQPENPFKYLGEYFMNRGLSMPLAESLKPEALELYWHVLDNELGETKLSTVASKAPRKTELEEWNEETEESLQKYLHLARQYENVPEKEEEPEVDDSIFFEEIPDRVKYMVTRTAFAAKKESQLMSREDDETEMLKELTQRKSRRLRH